MAICKFCGEQMEDGVSVCPQCGKIVEEPVEAQIEDTNEEISTEEVTDREAAACETTQAEAPDGEAAAEKPEEAPEGEIAADEPNEEPDGEIAPTEAPKKRPSTWKIIASVAAIVVLVGVLVGAILYGAGVRLSLPTNDIYCKKSYTVSDSEAVSGRDQVVATMGDRKLTNEELQIYYWMGVHTYLSRYQSYLSQQLDPSLPLDAQQSLSDDRTWQQFFLENALNTWHQYNAMCLKAEQEGFQLPQEDQEELDTLKEQLEKMAGEYEFESADAMLRKDVGAGGTVDGYIAYMRAYYTAMSYYSEQYEKMTPTQEEIDAYFTEHEAKLAESGVTKEKMQVDVRHILITPEGGVKGEDNQMTYSDEEWEACRVKAQELYDQWLDGEATEDSFAAMAAEHSADGSASNGGLYEKVTEGMMVEEFNDWIFAEGRKKGDHGLVKTQFGYHIMFYCQGEPIWVYQCREAILSERSAELIEGVMEQFPAKIRYRKIKLGFVDLANNK